MDPGLAFQEVRRHVREAREAAKPRVAADASCPDHPHEPKTKQATNLLTGAQPISAQ